MKTTLFKAGFLIVAFLSVFSPLFGGLLSGKGTPPEGVRQIEIRVQGLNKRPQAGKLRAFFVP